MKKKFLVTVSNDFDQLTAIEFLCSFFLPQSRHQLTLYHICRLDSNDMNKALLQMWDEPDARVAKRLSFGARKSLDRATDMLGSSQMSVDDIITKTVAERFGKVKDILSEGAGGLYDAIILGKRASYALQWFFERPADEIAQAIVNDPSFSTPLWICPEIEQGRKNVLVCLDGSKNSDRVVDHVGYILTRQTQHSITLYVVDNGAGIDHDIAFNRAREILAGHDISNERIDTDSEWGISVSNCILAKAAKGHYAAVAVGLHGRNKGLLKDIRLSGGATAKLISRIEKASLWVCP
jgi:hypothetical protein